VLKRGVPFNRLREKKDKRGEKDKFVEEGFDQKKIAPHI